MPLVIRHGDRLSGRRADLVQHVDLLPTLFGLLGIPAPERARGRDLFSESLETAPVLSEMRSSFVRDGIKLSLVKGDRKLIYTPIVETVELYDLATDPREQRDLSRQPERSAEVRALMEELLSLRNEDRLALVPASPPKTATPEELEKLKSLGYVR